MKRFVKPNKLIASIGLTMACLVSIATAQTNQTDKVETKAQRDTRTHLSQPNIVFILVDDLGWNELGFMGAKFYETPNIDQLAKDSLHFSDAYSACCVCSPSRAALLTGKYPARLHITDYIPGTPLPNKKLLPPRDWLKHLPPEEPNIAKTLKAAGYTTGIFGKWHLGDDEIYWPENQGFDVNVGGCSKGAPASYFSPYSNPRIKDGPPGEFLSDRLTREAIAFMKNHQKQPFFVYLSHYAVHTPLDAKPEVIAKYEAKKKAGNFPKKANPVYAALIESVDDSVGDVRKALADFKIADHTIIILTSDNGSRQPIITDPYFHGNKGSAYEGGVRVPLVINWPDVTKAGAVCHTPVIGVDLYPTILAMTGAKDFPNHIVDGVNLVPLIQGDELASRDIYWHYPHYHKGGATPFSAIRDGDSRLIQFQEDGHLELYNIKNDICETNNLTSEMPDKAKMLEGNVLRWRAQVGAQMAIPNPKFDPNFSKPNKQKKSNSDDN
jgi:arylsulfatase A-like enzyme